MTRTSTTEAQVPAKVDPDDRSVEVVPEPKDEQLPSAKRLYDGISQVPLTDEEAKQLAEPFPDDIFDVKPTGEVYASHVHVRRRLNQVLGVGRWSLMPASPVKMAPGGTELIRLYHLYIRGAFVGEGIGGAKYHPSNPQQTYDDAMETCQSVALNRATKFLGMTDMAWDKREAEAWRAAHAVRVTVQTPRGPKSMWRRKDAAPFPGEGGTAPAEPVAAPARAATGARPAGAQETGRRSNSTTSAPRGRTMGISEPKQRLVHARAGKVGLRNGELNAWLKAHFGLDHVADIDFRRLDEVLERLESTGGQYSGEAETGEREVADWVPEA